VIPEWARPLVTDVVQAAAVFIIVAFLAVATMLWDATRKPRRRSPIVRRKGVISGHPKGGINEIEN
jgi:hypothetical protein